LAKGTSRFQSADPRPSRAASARGLPPAMASAVAPAPSPGCDDGPEDLGDADCEERGELLTEAPKGGPSLPAARGRAVSMRVGASMSSARGPTFERVGQSRVYIVRALGLSCFVGPHWYCTLILLSFILAVGIAFTTQVATSLNLLHQVLGCVATVWSSYALLRCAAADPGMLSQTPGAKGGPGKPTQLFPSAGGRTCAPCGREQLPGELHCEFCHICIAGWDHHCPWMNKCIGADNLAAFYNFLCVSFSWLGYMVLISLYASTPA